MSRFAFSHLVSLAFDQY